MILFPAIDLKDGQCVRLREGRMDRATVFNRDPGAQARAFEEQGFKWIHVVDLDGAFAGKTANAGAVARILSSVRIPVQIGGGVRNLESVAYWIDAGTPATGSHARVALPVSSPEARRTSRPLSTVYWSCLLRPRHTVAALEDYESDVTSC